MVQLLEALLLGRLSLESFDLVFGLEHLHGEVWSKQPVGRSA